MREIEFRGYDPDTKRWYYGSYVRQEQYSGYAMGYDWDKHEKEAVEHFIYYTQMNDWGLETQKYRASVDPDSVGQYVGHPDKNGKRIYEGDIISIDDTEAIVQYEDLGFVAFGHLPEVRRNVSTWCNILSQDAEVIGNTYEKETYV